GAPLVDGAGDGGDVWDVRAGLRLDLGPRRRQRMDREDGTQHLLAMRAVHALEGPRGVDRAEAAEDVEAVPRPLGGDRPIAADDRPARESNGRRARVLRFDRLLQRVRDRHYLGGRAEEVADEVELVD